MNARANPTAHEIRTARDAAEGKILETIREFEKLTGCEVRKVELVRAFCGTTRTEPQLVMLDIEIGRFRVVPRG